MEDITTLWSTFQYSLFPKAFSAQMDKINHNDCMQLENYARRIYDNLEDNRLQNKNDLMSIEIYYETLLAIEIFCPKKSVMQPKTAQEVKKAIELLK